MLFMPASLFFYIKKIFLFTKFMLAYYKSILIYGKRNFKIFDFKKKN